MIVPRWLGRKGVTQAIPHLMSLMPPKFDSFVEPFGGSGTMTCAMRAAPRRRWNDLDSQLFGVAKTLQMSPKRLQAESLELFGLPHVELGDRLWRERTRENRERLTPAEFACVSALTVGGRMHGRLHESDRPGWLRWIHSIPKVSEYLSGVTLTCRDAVGVIRAAPSGAWIYCDPPYERTGKSYSSYVASVDWDAMFYALAEHDGPVTLSGYWDVDDCPLASLSGWRCVETPRYNGVRGVLAKGFGRPREFEWINYDDPRLTLFDF